ncbi:mutS protein homolog 4-like isoform X2 [Halichondria panicea]|uniref:mutS protein homolog 4-like isoform X2 n=1 Tax=Halichondria panicea TaxID=6063 RepID=UPI00312B5FD6
MSEPKYNSSNSANNSSFMTPGLLSTATSSTAGFKPRGHASSSKTPHTTGSRFIPATTPGSRHERSTTIVAVVEGRGLATGEVGLASIDLKRPELVLSQFPDTRTYVKVLTKLLILEPLEILMPHTVCDVGAKTKLYQLVAEQFAESTITSVQRKYFNESKGLAYVHQLCAQEFNTVELDISTKYYCLAAAAALLKYAEFIQHMMFAPNSIRVSYKGSEHTTMIDVTTVKNLELLTNSLNPRSCHSLYGLINFTKTPCGARLLRSNILEPPSHLETIKLRQDCVQELTENEALFFGLETVLKQFMNVDQLISFCVQVPKRETPKTADTTIGYVIHLKHTLQLVAPLRQALADAKNPLIKACHQVLDDPRFDILLSKINAVVHDDTHYQKGALNIRTQKCFCLKSDTNSMLNVTRKLYSEIIEDIALMTEQLSSEHGLTLRSVFNCSRGFYLQMTPEGGGAKKGGGGVSNIQLPDVFIKVVRHKNCLSFTTFDLMRLNARANDALAAVYQMSYIVLKELLSDIREQIGCLYKLTESVAMLDMLHSFAHSCTVSDYVRPEFTNTLAVKQGRHPMLEKISYDPPIPNNAYASTGSNFIIITGPNTSGKSTFLRQIALLQILAQMGSFVPAEYASFRLTNQIFSRIGSDDDLETNASTFMVEMREVQYILQNVDSTSLVIIDELGRGTSSEEGVGLCQAICEHLLSTEAITFFSTHFLELTRLEALYPNVDNYHFEIKYTLEDGAKRMTHTHTLSKGKTEERHYGLQLAELCMPPEVVAEAREIAAKIERDQSNGSAESVEAQTRAATYTLGTQLVQIARNSLLDADSLRTYLSHLKRDYLAELDTIKDSQRASNKDPTSEE